MVVIPIMLLLSFVSILYLHILRTQIDSAENTASSHQARYLAKSALQMARLEIQAIGEIKNNASKGNSKIKVSLTNPAPDTGLIVVGGNKTNKQTPYIKTGIDEIELQSPLLQNIPSGTGLYLCRDLDGDGGIGTLASQPFENGVIEVRRLNQERQPTSEIQIHTPLIFQANASIGIYTWTIEHTVILQ
jgi:hypothetical protein